jgi:hypothetical protein
MKETDTHNYDQLSLGFIIFYDNYLLKCLHKIVGCFYTE